MEASAWNSNVLIWFFVVPLSSLVLFLIWPAMLHKKRPYAENLGYWMWMIGTAGVFALMVAIEAPASNATHVAWYVVLMAANIEVICWLCCTDRISYTHALRIAGSIAVVLTAGLLVVLL